MITNFMLNSKLILGAFALALTATTAFAQDAEVITKPAAKKKAVYAQQTFGYVEKSMFSTNTLKLEVLSTEPVVWNGKVIIINHGSTGRGHGTNGMDESRVKNTVKFLTLRKALVEKGYRVYVLMRKGRGNSEGQFTEENAKTCGLSDQNNGVLEAESQLDQFVDSIRTENKVDKVIVMGHSRGGFLTSYYSQAHPDKVALAVNISGGWSTQCEEKNRMTAQMLENSGKKYKNQTWVYASNDTYFSERIMAGYADTAQQLGIPFIKLETLSGDGHAFASANPQLWLNQIAGLAEAK